MEKKHNFTSNHNLSFTTSLTVLLEKYYNKKNLNCHINAIRIKYFVAKIEVNITSEKLSLCMCVEL